MSDKLSVWLWAATLVICVALLYLAMGRLG